MEALIGPCESLGLAVEFIIVDDASTDGTAHILETQLKNQKNVVVLNQPNNLGPGPARNAGLLRASGDWVWFLDDDDELLQSSLLSLLKTLVELDEHCEVLAHSLNRSYTKDLDESRLQVGRRVLMFQEKQEVFNYLVRRSLLEAHKIKFSSGYHEDIRFVFDIIRYSRGLAVLTEAVVHKQWTPGAITSTMNAARTAGYIQAFNEIIRIGQSSEQSSVFYEEKRLFEQVLGVILYLINKEDDDEALSLLDHLSAISSSDDSWSKYVNDIPIIASTATNFKYAGSIWRQKKDGDLKSQLSSLRQVFQTRLSCRDLDSSLFLGPDEIRACCKRFFVGTERKGDVVLLDAAEDIGIQEIQASKDDLISRINANDANECSGCPYIERRPTVTSGISYISLENFSYCNMRCTYCSPKYYGGTEASYNAAEIIAKLVDTPGGLDESCHVVWGGGEPTLSQHFDAINQSLVNVPQVYKIRVLSNSLRYSPSLESVLSDPKFHIVTSIDAGSQSLFQEIRGRGKLTDVLENLQAYYKALKDKRRLTVKYILLANNHQSDELQTFVSEVQAAGLMDAMFQVSCDFTEVGASKERVCAMYELAVRLYMAGAKTVFFDDLIRDRLELTSDIADYVRKHMHAYGLDLQFILTPESDEQVVLWGMGMQSEWYLEKTTSGCSGNILGVVGDQDQFRALGHIAEKPQVRIFPSGVQSMYEIIQTIEASGLGQRIYKGVIL
tara:strand:+ start:1925 stop:4102 length:2178 start_codon:yes stop_codon:yes gene_type:complete